MSFIPYLIHPLRERFLQIEPKQDTFDVTGISIGHREQSYNLGILVESLGTLHFCQHNGLSIHQALLAYNTVLTNVHFFNPK